MSHRNPNLEEPERIQMLLQRLCRQGEQVHLQVGAWLGDFLLQGVDANHLMVALPDVTRGQWGVRKGDHASLRVVDRGKVFEAVVTMASALRFRGEESCQFEIPRALQAVDPHRLADFVPDRGIPCLFSDSASNVVEGKALAFGLEGLEAGPLDGKDVGRFLKVGTFSSVELIFPDHRLVLPSKVKYLERAKAGFLFEPLPREMLGAYQAWLFTSERAQLKRDREALDAAGTVAPGLEPEHKSPSGPRIQVFSDRDPMLLVLCEGETLPRHLAESLGRKFGVCGLDYVQGSVGAMLGDLAPGPGSWGRIRLLLVHQRLKVASGLDLVHQLTLVENCPLPVLLMGTEDDALLKRNRAIAAGAVDFLPVEPFHVLRVMRVLEETLRMFA